MMISLIILQRVLLKASKLFNYISKKFRFGTGSREDSLEK